MSWVSTGMISWLFYIQSVNLSDHLKKKKKINVDGDYYKQNPCKLLYKSIDSFPFFLSLFSTLSFFGNSNSNKIHTKEGWENGNV